jgi:hypothetical protein
VLSYERGRAKGSGRGVDRISLIDLLNGCSDLLESWDGHPSAVGVTIKLENLDAFRTRFCEVVASKMQQANFDDIIEIARELNIDDVDDYFMRGLELSHPFGQGNPEPVFLLKSVTIGDKPELFGTAKTHVTFWLNRRHAKRMLVIGWEMANNIPPIGVSPDLAVKVSLDFWNGNKFKLIIWWIGTLQGNMDAVVRYFGTILADQIEKLCRYHSLISEWNTKVNVVSRKDIGNFSLKHTVPCFSINKVVNFEPESSVVDVGTGGGFLWQ